jgi:hypothetical protein
MGDTHLAHVKAFVTRVMKLFFPYKAKLLTEWVTMGLFKESELTNQRSN